MKKFLAIFCTCVVASCFMAVSSGAETPSIATGSVSYTASTATSIKDAKLSTTWARYTGGNVMPNVLVGSTKLENGKDYTVKYNNCVNVGGNPASVTLTGMGNYSGTVTLPFTVIPAVTYEVPVTTHFDLSCIAYSYTGEAITPSVILTSETGTWEEGIDYTLTYKKNINVSISKETLASGVITGKKSVKNPSWTGSFGAWICITPKALSDTDVSKRMTASYGYTGNAICPLPVVYAGTRKLVKDTDYTLTYANNTAVGKGTVTITGKGNYTGSTTCKFSITKTAMNKTVISLGSSYTYTGKALTPLPVITYGGRTLVKDTDYTVAYKNNTNVGYATVKITGKGNYTGTVTKTFKVAAMKLGNVVTAKTSYTYTGKAIKAAVAVYSVSGKTPLRTSDYTVSYKNNTKVGTATVTIKGKGNYTGTVTKTYKIVPISATRLVYNVTATPVYTGKTITPRIKVTYGGKTVSSTNYTVSKTSSANVGKVTFTVTFKPANPAKKFVNCYTGTKVVNTYINPKVPRLSATCKTGYKISLKTSGTTGGDAYQCNISTSKTFAPDVATSTITSSTATYSMKKAGTFYIRVRACKTVGNATYYSGWSTTKKVTCTK